ncbi:MAG TPA: B-box zinc finger protein [bacterium]|nr:B-box zinc finger protein [bacterium]HPP30120.1 B-box zinc finger protein [bacterium]
MSECFFHTGRPAVARCKQCGRPLCTECRIIKPDGIFCSVECAERFSVFARRAEELEAKRSKSSGVAGLIKFIIFLVILFVIYLIIRKFL